MVTPEACLSPAVCYHVYHLHQDRSIPVGRHRPRRLRQVLPLRGGQHQRPAAPLGLHDARGRLHGNARRRAAAARGTASDGSPSSSTSIGSPARFERRATRSSSRPTPRPRPTSSSARRRSTRSRCCCPATSAWRSARSTITPTSSAARSTIAVEGHGPMHSVCVAFGLERWVHAFLAQHGEHPEDWPAVVRDAPGVSPDGAGGMLSTGVRQPACGRRIRDGASGSSDVDPGVAASEAAALLAAVVDASLPPLLRRVCRVAADASRAVRPRAVLATDGARRGFVALIPRQVRLRDRLTVVYVLSFFAVHPDVPRRAHRAGWRSHRRDLAIVRSLTYAEPRLARRGRGAGARRPFRRGWTFRRLAELRTYARAGPRRSRSACTVVARQATVEEFLAASRMPRPPAIAWSQPTLEQVKHYLADPRGSCFAVVQGLGRLTLGGGADRAVAGLHRPRRRQRAVARRGVPPGAHALRPRALAQVCASTAGRRRRVRS